MKYTQSICHISLLFLFFVIFSINPLAVASDEKPAPRNVRAGVFNFDGYHSRDNNGILKGYGMDLLTLLAEYSHLNFIFQGYDKSWKDMQAMLRNGEIDLVSSARRTPEREEIFAFSLPVGRNQTILSKKLQNSQLRAGDYKSYNGMKIGAVRGSSQNNYLPDFARDKGFTYTLIEMNSPKELEVALQNGDIDAILSSNLRKPNNETVLDIIKSDNFYVIARKEDQALIDEINYAIEQMNQNEGDWQNDLYYRHYGPEIFGKPEFSEREQSYINDVSKGKKTVKAISRDDMPPYSFVEGGILKGILPEYFGRVMQMAQIPYELVAPKNPEEYKDKFDNNEVDVILDYLDDGNAREDQEISGFATNPYMVTGLARVIRNDFKGPVKVLALPDKTAVDMESPLLKDVEIKRYNSALDAMRAVQNGEADAAYVLPFTAQMFVNREIGNGLIYTMMNNGGASFRMFVPAATEHELVTILKKSIKGLPAGTMNQLGSKYISFNADEMSLFHYLYSHPQILFISMLGIMFSAALIIIMWQRGRFNKRLLAATERANRDLEGQLAIVEALSRDYTNVFAINSNDGQTSIIKIADGATSIDESDRLDAADTYNKLVENYINLKVHPDDRKDLSEILDLSNVRKELAAKNEFSGTYRIMTNGQINYFQFTFVRPQENGERNDNLILIGLRNIDEVIRKEQQQKKELADALEQARYASAAKTAFLNNMSHDIRTPMNAIIGFTTLAASNAENVPLVKRYLDKIMTSGNHLLSLINDVLDMSRIESGKVKIEDQEVNLPEILHDLRTIVQADVKSKKLDFQIDTINISNETIFCDKLRLNQVLLNILSNAIKYTQNGGKVSVSVEQLAPALDGHASYDFHIKDNGIGMSREFLEHVFEPFEREQTSTVSGIQGTGLGLAITKNIVDMMGGKISVESVLGKGSEFVVSLRVRVLEERVSDSCIKHLAGLRVLIVDDDIKVCKNIAKMLEQQEMQPDWTTRGKEAILRMQSANIENEPYDVYLVDWKVSDMDGIALVRRLRKTVPDNVPIIILTSYDWTDMEEEGRAAGVTAFCSKPLFISDLCNILANQKPQISFEEQKPYDQELFKGKRILLAEDNEMNQEIAQMILENAGFKMDIVENGLDAVDKLNESPEDYYDLVLMDVQMPVMNGYEATRAIRKLEDPVKSGIPIVAMTANAFEEDRDEALRSGMDGYTSKPIDIDKLMETLGEILLKRTNASAGEGGK